MNPNQYAASTGRTGMSAVTHVSKGTLFTDSQVMRVECKHATLPDNWWCVGTRYAVGAWAYSEQFILKHAVPSEDVPCSDYVLRHFPIPCKPRKKQHCCICGENILPGDDCCRWNGLVPGAGYRTSHAHPECYDITRKWDDGDWECCAGDYNRPRVSMKWPIDPSVSKTCDKCFSRYGRLTHQYAHGPCGRYGEVPRFVFRAYHCQWCLAAANRQLKRAGKPLWSYLKWKPDADVMAETSTDTTLQNVTKSQ